MAAIRAGVTSYIRKDCDVQEIIDAVTRTADGSKFFCGKVLDVLRKASVDVDQFLQRTLVLCSGRLERAGMRGGHLDR